MGCIQRDRQSYFLAAATFMCGETGCTERDRQTESPICWPLLPCRGNETDYMSAPGSASSVYPQEQQTGWNLTKKTDPHKGKKKAKQPPKKTHTQNKKTKNKNQQHNRCLLLYNCLRVLARHGVVLQQTQPERLILPRGGQRQGGR